MAKFTVACSLEVDTKEGKIVFNTPAGRLVCIAAKRGAYSVDLVKNDRPLRINISKAKELVKAIGQQLLEPKHLESHDSTNT